ncbi:MAG: hypothetical protein L6R38_005020 [Xanthoria sp. 2 TBL-2021]|nr:MAG: hypothetical protein L6R38_005020 [Xanthoria sp. 2 TBL-2021]
MHPLTFSSRNAANYASEKIQGGGAQASKEANKSVAKDSHVPIGTRIRAAGDMVSDKMDQHGHEADAKVHKEQAKRA